jgi:hypothetical protein
VKGLDWAHVSLLLGIAALFVGLTLRSFARRDITIGGASNLRLRDMLARVFG